MKTLSQKVEIRIVVEQFSFENTTVAQGTGSKWQILFLKVLGSPAKPEQLSGKHRQLPCHGHRAPPGPLSAALSSATASKCRGQTPVLESTGLGE